MKEVWIVYGIEWHISREVLIICDTENKAKKYKPYWKYDEIKIEKYKINESHEEK